MSPLAKAIYTLLRQRTSLPDPRVTYAELTELLREHSEEFAEVHHRNRQLYAALWEVGDECRRLGVPLLPALVVRSDTRRPGEAYFAGSAAGRGYRGERIAAWRKELEAVRRTSYPAG
jgi:hypothetical protein